MNNIPKFDPNQEFKEVDVTPVFDSNSDYTEVEPSFLQSLKQEASDLIRTLQPFGEDIKDFATGVVAGGSGGMADELGGIATAGIESGLGLLGIGPAASEGEISIKDLPGLSPELKQRLEGQTISLPDESFLEKARGYQKASEAEFLKSQKESPWLYGAGNLAGGVASSIAAGSALGLGKAAQGAKSISEIARNKGKLQAIGELTKRGVIDMGKATPLLALETAMTSEKTLLGEGSDVSGVAGEVVDSLAFGLPTVLGLRAVGDVVAPAGRKGMEKASQRMERAIEKSPYLSGIKHSYTKYGQEYKVNPSSPELIKEGMEGIEGGTAFSQLNTKRAAELTGDVLKDDKILATAVGDALDNAVEKIEATDIRKNLLQNIQALSTEMPEVLKDKNFIQSMKKILSRNYSNVSAREIKAAMQDVENIINRIHGTKNVSAEYEQAKKLLEPFRNELDKRLKDTIPDYRTAAERFYQYRRAYMEQPIVGATPIEKSNLMYGSLDDNELKLNKAYENLIEKSNINAQSASKPEQAYSNLADSVRNFQKEEAKRLAEGRITKTIGQDPAKLMKSIDDYATDAEVRRATRKTLESQGGIATGMKDVLGLGQTGRGWAYSGAYHMGRASQTKPAQSIAKMSRAIYNAPAETLNGLAAKLEANKATSMFGKALREGMENGDMAKKNAALFTIMQNPNARLFVEEDANEEDNM